MAPTSLYLWNGQALYIGQSDTEAHRHHALIISIGIGLSWQGVPPYASETDRHWKA